MSRNKTKPSKRSAKSKEDPSRRGAPEPSPDKPQPRRLQGVAADSPELEQGHPLWRLSLLDRGYQGQWSWKTTEEIIHKIVDFLIQMERLPWKEVRRHMAGGKNRGSKHKPIPIESLCQETQQRLQELELEDCDELFRFRTGWDERLWGVLSHENPRVFYPIWWDPYHKVCPGKDPN